MTKARPPLRSKPKPARRKQAKQHEDEINEDEEEAPVMPRMPPRPKSRPVLQKEAETDGEESEEGNAHAVPARKQRLPSKAKPKATGQRPKKDATKQLSAEDVFEDSEAPRDLNPKSSDGETRGKKATSIRKPLSDKVAPNSSEPASNATKSTKKEKATKLQQSKKPSSQKSRKENANKASAAAKYVYVLN
jgi:hypothetical protein